MKTLWCSFRWLALLPLLINTAGAYTQWQVSGTGNWFDEGNWSNGVPSALEQAVSIPNSGTAVINAGFALAATPEGLYFGVQGGP